MKTRRVHTLVIGSGAAGLCAALRLKAEGVDDILVVTEGLLCGTSINTGSDKQTYYKMGMYAGEPDSPAAMAQSYTASGSVHGDIALVESALSVRCFLHLADLGVPFPHDEWGQYIGYKTDHDPCRRATSCGPHTSREMCRALIRAVKEKKIEIQEHRWCAGLFKAENRVAGAIIRNRDTGETECATASFVIFAAGGPGGLYANSVYPGCHSGGIGIALEAGAKARNLPESQYGLASVKFRWNVSGTYMQVLPRVISTNAKGGDEREFLRDHFSDGELNSRVFLKGYQWPFDVKKVPDGSSQIDVLVDEETRKGRRVFLDYRSNPENLDFSAISEEARNYLERSGALGGTPLERLRKMNPGAIELYREHQIDLAAEPLGVAVCAQHNNGGLAGDLWYESENLPGLFPIGEVNGSHGVTRPGGSALNAGQVGAFRAAEYIAHAPVPAVDEAKVQAAAEEAAKKVQKLLSGTRRWEKDLKELRERTSRFAGFQRPVSELAKAESEAKALYEAICKEGFAADSSRALVTAQLALSSWAYLSAIRFQAESGAGSRGSGALVDERGKVIPENPEFRKKILTTVFENGEFRHEYENCRPVPDPDGWFETVWAQYREGKLFSK